MALAAFTSTMLRKSAQLALTALLLFQLFVVSQILCSFRQSLESIPEQPQNSLKETVNANSPLSSGPCGHLIDCRMDCDCFFFAVLASAYFCGVNAKRALQHAVFIVPFIALWLLSLPARSNKSRSGWQKVCLAAAVVGLLLTFIDAALRSFSSSTYSANPCRLSYWNQQPIPILTKL